MNESLNSEITAEGHLEQFTRKMVAAYRKDLYYLASHMVPPGSSMENSGGIVAQLIVRREVLTELGVEEQTKLVWEEVRTKYPDWNGTICCATIPPEFSIDDP